MISPSKAPNLRTAGLSLIRTRPLACLFLIGLMLSGLIPGKLQAQHRHLFQGQVITIPNALQRTTTTPVETWDRREIQNWDANSSIWIPSSLENVIRDAQSRITENILQVDNGSGFQNNRRSTFTYTGSGIEWTERIQETWNGSGWTLDERAIRSYDAQGNLSLEMYQDWTAGAWDTVQAQRRTHTYDSNNLLQETQVEEWNGSTRTFQFTQRERYAYNAANETDTAWFDDWNNPGWTTRIRVVDIQWFDFAQDLPLEFTQQTPASGGNFDPQRRFTYQYGPNNSNTETAFAWVANTWLPDEQDSTRLDAQMRPFIRYRSTYANGSYTPFDVDSSENTYRTDLQPLTIQELSLDLSSQTWQNQTLAIYGYGPVGRPEPQQAPLFRLFPIPIHSAMHLQTDQAPPGDYHLEIYDVLGRKVMASQWRQGPGNHTREWDLSQLQSGSYAYRIYNRTQQQTGKLLKK